MNSEIKKLIRNKKWLDLFYYIKKTYKEENLRIVAWYVIAQIGDYYKLFNCGTAPIVDICNLIVKNIKPSKYNIRDNRGRFCKV
jgi:hypothetical protein